MAPLDWDKLMEVDVAELQEDPGYADDMFDVLTEFDPGGEKNAEKLKKLFTVSQAIMNVKHAVASVAEEELQEKVTEEGRLTARRDQDIEDLKRELEYQKRKVKDLERGFDTSGRAAPKDTRFLREELIDLERQNLILDEAVKEKERQLNKEKETSDRYITRAEDAERELKELRRENTRLQDEIHDYRRQMDVQRDSILSKRDDDKDMQDKMFSKNKLLNVAVEENKNLADDNVKLREKIEELKEEMREGREEMERTADDYLKHQAARRDIDQELDRLRRQNEMLNDQVAELLAQVRSKGDADDEIMVQVNNKVEEWKSVLADKDIRIQQLQEQVVDLREKIVAHNMDSEKTSVAALSKALEEKDKQIEDLKRRLDEAAGDIEYNTALMQDVQSELRREGRGTSNKQIQKLMTLQDALKAHEGQVKDAEAKANEAEGDAREKDKALSEALERMRQYEAGEYGLAEAVAEIKEHKVQVQIRDRTVEDLTKYINKCEEKINDLYDENEDLREKLGLDPKEPLDLGEYRKKKGLRLQEDRALNRVLQKEIEGLEEERIELKQQIRKMAQTTSTRAVAMGLSADDLVEVDNFIDTLKEKKRTATAREIKAKAEQDALRIRNIQLDKDLETNAQKIDRISQENAEFKAKNKQLEGENDQLEKGLREINQAIQEQSGGDDAQPISCPTLERMLAAIEAKNLLGKYDTSLFLKAKVDNLTGHNEELRKELKETRYETTKATVDLEKAQSKAERLEAEVKTLREAGAGGWFQTMPLPEGMAATSSDVIASLNEHLVQVLQELSLKEDMVVKMESSLETYRRKFAVMRHQQGLLYKDFIDEKKEWETSVEKLNEEIKKLQGCHEDDQVRVQEFDRLVDTLAQDEVEVRRRLSDMTRKITVLRVNEKALTRRYNALQDVENMLRKDNTKLKNDMISMEAAVAERLGYLQRYKDMASFKIAALQKALEDSVPAADLDQANKQYTELTEKYRDMLEKSNTLVAETEQNSGYEVEVKRLNDQNNYLKQEMEIEKEKLHTLEAAFENIRRRGMASSSDLSSSDVISISKKLTTLEMKELNERQRAEHASRMYEHQKKQLRSLEDRNFELERKFAELTKMNIEMQKEDRELRDELANCVTKAVSDADRSKIMKLEEVEAQLKVENSKLKDIAEVATMQVRAFESQQQSRDKEVISLRQQLVDFQAQSDEKTVIGKLHRHIVQLQVSEGMALRKLEDSNKKLMKRDAQLLRTEHKVDEKDNTIFHNRQESRNKTKHLKGTINDLRRKYAGAVPLPQQEKFAQSMLKLQTDKKQIEDDLAKTNAERIKIEDKLAEVELQHKGLQDLIVTLQDGRGAQKVAEWHGKMEQLRLEELRQKREIERLKHQIKFHESIIKKHEAEVLSLQEQQVRETKAFEEREMEWEHRESELDRIITGLERQQAAIAGAASQFEEAVGALPDPSWPVARQLEEAVTTIKKNVKMILDSKAQVAGANKRVEDLEREVKQKDSEVLTRDKVITELRLRLPASVERDQAIAKATAKLTGGAYREEDEDYEGNQAVKVAQSTVHSLQARIAQKEETLQKYQELLRQTREDMRIMNLRHEEEMNIITEKLHSKTDAAFSKYKQAVMESLNKPSASVPTNEQLKRLNELEDIVADQDNSISAIRDKLSRARQDTQDWRLKYEDAIRHHGEDKDRIMDEQQMALRELRQQMEEMEQQLEGKDKEIDVVQEELEITKEANTRAPTTTMKKLVERLRNDLALKEKQHKALSKALLELRADMVTQAQEDVKANAQNAHMEQNLQKVIDAHTKDLQDRVEELDTQNQKWKQDAKKRKNREVALNTEMDETKQDLVKKETQVKKLKSDKSRLETEVEELEKKVERMSTMHKQKAPPEAAQQELEELRRKNRLLQEDLRRSKHQAEKPYEQQAKEGKEGHEMVARWEESKKWQKMVDRLKGRVKEKEQEIEKLTKSNELMKHGLERANKDKESLESKLRVATRGGATSEVVSKQTSSHLGAAPPSGPAMHNMQELSRKNYDLEEEVANLKRQLAQGRDAAFQEVQIRNKFLTDKLVEMEQQLAQRTHQPQDLSVGANTYRELARKEADLQKQVIKMSEENIELRFEVEQANKDIPRLKARIDDLQKYVEVLKAEKEHLQLGNSARSWHSSLSSQMSNVRRIGDSGRSTRDLEKTIALLKKVVERTQMENEQLKRAPGVVSNDQMKMLQNENQGLKNQLEELRQKMGAQLSERYVSQQKGTVKMMADYDTLRRDLMKEMESNEKLRINLKQQEILNEQLQKRLDSSKQKLEIEEAKHPSMTSMDSKGWKSVVVTRMYEEKVKALDDDLGKKNKILEDMKTLLREAAQREQDLLHEREELLQKVELLERFPPGSQATDAEVIREYQLARLTIERLENEKKELLHEMQVLRKQVNADAGGPLDASQDDVVAKLVAHNKLMEENVDMHTRLKASELEKDHLHAEVVKLKKELENFGPEFFEEIEDLKYNYREAVQKNVQYEEQLTQLSKQFGVSVNVPGL